MRTRGALSNFTLSLLGAAAVTAGALFFQFARRPAPRGSDLASSGSSVPSPPQARPLDVSPRDAALDPDESFLRRLREHGL